MDSSNPTSRTRGSAWALAALVVSLGGCGADGGGGAGFAADGGGGLGSEPDAAARDAAPAPPADDAALPPEQEVEALTFSLPAAGRTSVFVASPQNDVVVRIDARTLEVTTTEAGDEPWIVRTRPGADVAVALNRGSDDLTRVTVDAQGRSQATTVPLGHHFNRLELSPDGAYAVCFFDLSSALAGEDASSLQDLTVVDLDEATSINVAVGFRPRQVLFLDDGRALVVTADGISVVTLAAPGLPPLVPLTADAFASDDREVAVTPNGRFVVSYGPGENGVTVVELDVGEPRVIDLGALPTDLDLLADGRRALVMLRGSRQAAIVDLASSEVELLPLDAPLGSAAVSPRGDIAVLYTTVPAANLRPQVRLLDLDTGASRDRPLRKEIAGVVVDPVGKTAFVLHRKSPGDPDPTLEESEFLARSHGFSVLDLETGFARLQTTAAEPSGVAFLEDGSGAYAVLSDELQGVAQLLFVALERFDVHVFELGSPPEFVGLLPRVERAFVTQTHPEGRVSFVELGATSSTRLETVSGYLLNGRID